MDVTFGMSSLFIVHFWFAMIGLMLLNGSIFWYFCVKRKREEDDEYDHESDTTETYSEPTDSDEHPGTPRPR